MFSISNSGLSGSSNVLLGCHNAGLTPHHDAAMRQGAASSRINPASKKTFFFTEKSLAMPAPSWIEMFFWAVACSCLACS
jgi:hypothetical protein